MCILNYLGESLRMLRQFAKLLVCVLLGDSEIDTNQVGTNITKQAIRSNFPVMIQKDFCEIFNEGSRARIWQASYLHRKALIFGYLIKSKC